jgi:hypothetical protein
MTTMLDKLANAMDPLAETDVDRFVARARVVRLLETLLRLNTAQIGAMCQDSAHYIVGDPEEVMGRLLASIIEEHLDQRRR